MTLGNKVFVSSTCYDLIDLRADVAEALRDMGLQPVLSDDYDSGFTVQTDKDSIETCLIHVRDADTVIIILSQRYGPSLKDSGFTDVSATQLEYNEAKAHKKGILFCVRDKTLVEYNGWKANNQNYVTRYVVNDKEKHNHRIFKLIDEHSKLANGGDPNWVLQFTTSVDLIKKLRKSLAASSAAALLQTLAEKNALPELRITKILGGPGTTIQITFANYGTIPALDLRVRLRQQLNPEPQFTGLAAPLQPNGERTVQLHIAPVTSNKVPDPYAIVDVDYKIPRGWLIRESFTIDQKLRYGHQGKKLMEPATTTYQLSDNPWSKKE